MAPEPPPVRELTADDLDPVVAVLSDAFGSYPTIRHVLQASAGGYGRDLRALIRFFATARLLRQEPILGATRGGELSGVALVSDPGGPPSPERLADIREAVWAQLGAGARGRYEAFGTAAASVLVDRPRLHLNMIGVRSTERGEGVSRRLLEEVHRRAGGHPTAEGVSLTTEDPSNLPLYEHFGYRRTGEARVSGDLVTWGMFRPNETAGAAPAPTAA